MYHDRQDLTALISSRICHDLVSPLGAISNGLELLNMSGELEGPEMELIAQSVANANSRIRFFRIAFGLAPNGSTLAQSEILSVLEDYFKDGRVSARWVPSREAQRRDVKLVFLAIQCLENALPYGGEIEITQEGTDWIIQAHSEKIRLWPEHWALLQGHEMTEDLNAAQVQFGLLSMLAQWRKPALSVSQSENTITIRL